MEFMTVEQINEKLIVLVRNERKITDEILNHIILFKKCGGYLKLGYSNMHEYMTRALGYSDDQTYRRLKAATLMEDIPEVAGQLKEGHLNLSQAAKIQKAFEASQKETGEKVTKDKKGEILKSVEGASNFETKDILAKELDLKPKEIEKAKPQSNNTVRLEINLTQEQFEKLQAIKSLLSHQVPDQKTGEVLEVLFDQFLNKNSFTKSKSAESSVKKSITECFMETKVKAENKGNPIKKAHARKVNLSHYIPVSVKHELFKRARGYCEFVGTDGVRCQSRYKLQVDHFVTPFSQGGENSIENCKIVCASHNAHRASVVGIGFETTTEFVYTNRRFPCPPQRSPRCEN